jgi:DNA-binding response OmpR family regulator
VDNLSELSVLLVDGEESMARLRAEVERGRPAALDTASGLVEAIQMIAAAPGLVVVEACLPDGDCLQLLQAARSLVQPPVIVVVSADAPRALVAQSMADGADAYLDKPLRLAELLATVQRVGDALEQCSRMARQLVGRIGLKQATVALRGSMNEEALTRTRGSRRAAANLLGVDRRYVQRMIEEFGEPDTLGGAA